MEKYDHKAIEQKWQAAWEAAGLYRTSDNREKPKCYVLDMFPYPSGEGLHVGHPKGYIATDIYSRMKTMQGFSVLHPMGWDAFGLPAEQYAIKNKVHPRVAVDKNTARYKEQLSVIGFNYDWEREVNTTDPAFYKWTQWIFLKMFEKGLAYESYEPINWCPTCQTGLANEDLEDGKCERCETVVEKKPMRQWVLRITDYADRMLADIDALDWPTSIKESQKNWIGRSEGAEIDFAIEGSEKKITVFTTRPDTLFGATYVVLAPEHKLLDELKDSVTNWGDVVTYRDEAKKQSEIERTAAGREKTGVKLEGISVVNPANDDKLPVFVADYVLGHYGTGAVMAVPAHDERDFTFAQKYRLPVMQVIEAPDGLIEKNVYRGTGIGNWVGHPEIYELVDKNTGKIFGNLYKNLGEECYDGKGLLINSNQFNGEYSEDAKKKITDFVKGRWVTKYRLKDWVFSRQRYWGEPIPLIHCEKCGVVPVAEKDLPVVLPQVESYAPTGTGESPLADIAEWVNTSCPKCGGSGKRETNTMPQWAGSSWYYLRYIDPKNEQALVDKEKESYWSPVDMYVGGAEHATRHLIYARFYHKFLYDIGVVNYQEPFKRLQNVGLIMAEDGRKMSKRWGNVINPDDIVATHGADTLRLYEMFMGPFGQSVVWSTESIIGPRRFLERVWRLKEKALKSTNESSLDAVMHKTIKKVGDDIEVFGFNTAISSLMILVNEMEKAEEFSREQYETLLVLLAPFAPHITEELWHEMGNTDSIHLATWPVFDPSKTVVSEVTIAIQVNGKVRDTIVLAIETSDEAIKEMALARPAVTKWIDGKEIKKMIVVKGKLLSIVVGD
ncbi:MAG: leucine--tRNA ligase [Candidatus Yonathbacteria bacterium RIFCSPLOWO2_01_FULL_47_33b]|uniref:Leucine--tRNA ligase n=1 Tax=Candidatus Yonathbacteria bacterium RIFCSPLOWO2_01_FULL_47_33b TaxID=1802727 RepID=A0A1G2SCP5_9BACT|nr:MAG: leucine--tRNA ligase [Candidatus Yonathbacteria bacterium RIFCSPLOWO2_01_FULL_47_33b]